MFLTCFRVYCLTLRAPSGDWILAAKAVQSFWSRRIIGRRFKEIGNAEGYRGKEEVLIENENFIGYTYH